MENNNHRKLLELSKGFIEQYKRYVVIQFQAYDTRGSDERTLRGQNKPDFMLSKRLESINQLDSIDKHPLEQFLKYYYPDQLKYIHNMLKHVHSVSITLNPKNYFLGLEEINDDRQLDLAIMRVIAGAIIVSLKPELFLENGEQAGALIQIKPNAHVQKKIQEALNACKSQGLELPHPLKPQLKLLANGIPLSTQLEPTNKTLKLMIREITLLGNHFFIINTSGKNRFSSKAIMAISEILNFRVPSERTIQSIQESFDGPDFDDAIPLSENLYDLRDT